jgi:uncharacterized membrane protein
MPRPSNLPANWRDVVSATVSLAEKKTAAEIKVVVLNYCWVDIREKARVLFFRHGLQKTKNRNAVMIVLVLKNREFLVYGDKGIHEKVTDEFWLHTRDSMLSSFQKGDIVEGLCHGVQLVGEKLALYFPYQHNDENELSDEVIYET